MISSVCSMLTAWYGNPSLQQSCNHAREAAASIYLSGHNIQADCQWCTMVPPFESSANAAPVSVQALSAVQVQLLAVVALKELTGNKVLRIMCLTWDKWG